MLAYEKKEDCAGCTACMNICPENVITMRADNEGFLYPHTDEELCSQCGLCQQICPFKSNFKIKGNYYVPEVYAVKHRDDQVRMNSSSGGMFTAISDCVLGMGGVVYGAAFDSQYRVCHQKAETAEERNMFRGSKYVQSDLNHVFADIKAELKTGRTVLFSGTPCQNAGLSAFLIKKYENLILCDIVCHGTPSPLLWYEYVGFLEKRNKSRLTSYSFRHKGIGWRGYNVNAVFDNENSKLNTPEVLTYTNIFGSDLALRSSCYNCEFANLRRPSDITIADFWGIERSMPDFDDNKGVSLVLINSPIGKSLFGNLGGQIEYRTSNTINCLQPNLQKPTALPPRRAQFWKEYHANGIEFILKKYGGLGAKQSAKRFIRNGLDKTGLLPLIKRTVRK